MQKAMDQFGQWDAKAAAMAREALNGDWYIGAMTDWNKRDLTINLDFLPKEKYKMSI